MRTEPRPACCFDPESEISVEFNAVEIVFKVDVMEKWKHSHSVHNFHHGHPARSARENFA